MYFYVLSKFKRQNKIILIQDFLAVNIYIDNLRKASVKTFEKHCTIKVSMSMCNNDE